MAEANVTSNNQLPPEVLAKIFEHCDVNELVNIVDVCQLWRDLAIHQYNTSGNDLVIRRPSDVNDLVTLLSKPVSFTKLHVVWDVPSGVDCSSVSLDALDNATSLTRLQSFTFKEDGPGVGHQYRYCRVLDALLTLILRQSSVCDTLTHLKLSYPGLQVHGKVLELIETCQHLSHLGLNSCTLCYEDEQKCKDIIPTLHHLQLLDLRCTSSFRFDHSFIAAVKRGCPNISNNIMIGVLEVSSTEDVRMLQFVSHVTELQICVMDTEQMTSLISCWNECRSRLSVDKLHVIRCTHRLTDGILLSLLQRLRALKVVIVPQCCQLTNEGVANVMTSSPELEEINLHRIKNIDRGIIQLLDRVVTKKSVRVGARGTKLSKQLRNSNPDQQLYTGKNRNICLWW